MVARKAPSSGSDFKMDHYQQFGSVTASARHTFRNLALVSAASEAPAASLPTLPTLPEACYGTTSTTLRDAGSTSTGVLSTTVYW